MEPIFFYLVQYLLCPDCDKTLPRERFYFRVDRPNALRHPRCKDCEYSRRLSTSTYRVANHFNSVKRRARTTGVTFELTTDWFRRKYQNGKCEVTGVKFDVLTKEFSARRPSVDRIDPTEGYTIKNSRMICHCMNLLFGPWGEEESLTIIIAYLKQIGFDVEQQQKDDDFLN